MSSGCVRMKAMGRQSPLLQSLERIPGCIEYKKTKTTERVSDRTCPRTCPEPEEITTEAQLYLWLQALEIPEIYGIDV